MLTIDQLKDLRDNRAKFQAVTGLTWDPTTITDQEFLDKIQWYFPKGAGFDKEHIAFDKELIINLGGIRGVDSEPYYNEEKKIDISDEATLSVYNIKPEDAKAADKEFLVNHHDNTSQQKLYQSHRHMIIVKKGGQRPSPHHMSHGKIHEYRQENQRSRKALL